MRSRGFPPSLERAGLDRPPAPGARLRASKFPGPLLGVVLALLLVPATLLAHQVLTGSNPADESVVDTLPAELRLTFYEAVRLPFTSVELLGPGGDPLELAELRVTGDSDRVLVVEVLGASVPGMHVVEWRTAGADGHAVQGRFGFEVRGPADDPNPVQGAREPGSDETGIVLPDVREPGFSASSPLFILVRWLSLGGLVALLGALAFRWGVLPAALRRSSSVDAIARPIARAVARVGIVAGTVLLILAPLRLVLQAATMTGGPSSIDPETLRIVATTGPWGFGWLLQVAGSLGALAGLVAARSGREPGWLVAAMCGTALALSSALSGHAAGGGSGSLALHAAHVIAGGVWLGGLSVLLLVGIPRARRLEAPGAAEATSALVGGFSLFAMLGVALLALTGAPAALRLTGSFEALVGTAYGRVLVLKLGAVLLMGVVGGYHALHLRPRLAEPGAAARLQRSGALEVGVGVVILLLTAVLVALPLPR